MRIINKLAEVKFLEDVGFEVPSERLLNTLYELEDANGIMGYVRIEDDRVAKYLVHKGVAVRMRSGAYRLENEKKRLELLDKVENLEEFDRGHRKHEYFTSSTQMENFKDKLQNDPKVSNIIEFDDDDGFFVLHWTEKNDEPVI